MGDAQRRGRESEPAITISDSDSEGDVKILDSPNPREKKRGTAAAAAPTAPPPRAASSLGGSGSGRAHGGGHARSGHARSGHAGGSRAGGSRAGGSRAGGSLAEQLGATLSGLTTGVLQQAGAAGAGRGGGGITVTNTVNISYGSPLPGGDQQQPAAHSPDTPASRPPPGPASALPAGPLAGGNSRARGASQHHHQQPALVEDFLRDSTSSSAAVVRSSSALLVQDGSCGPAADGTVQLGDVLLAQAAPSRGAQKSCAAPACGRPQPIWAACLGAMHGRRSPGGRTQRLETMLFCSPACHRAWADHESGGGGGDWTPAPDAAAADPGRVRLAANIKSVPHEELGDAGIQMLVLPSDSLARSAPATARRAFLTTLQHRGWGQGELGLASYLPSEAVAWAVAVVREGA